MTAPRITSAALAAIAIAPERHFPKRFGGDGGTMLDLFDRIAPLNFDPKLRWPTPKSVIWLRMERAEAKRARKAARRIA